MIEHKSFTDYTQEDVSAANRMMYASAADDYDDVVITANSYLRLKELLELAVSLVQRRKGEGGRLKAIDICGGTGNASFVLDDLNCSVDMIDISSTMIEQFQIRCQREQRTIHSHCVDAAEYLQSVSAQKDKGKKKYDIVVFSSALHHFRFPGTVIAQALPLLKPYGILVTVADPTLTISAKWFRLGSSFDRLIHLLLCKPREGLKKISEKWMARRSILKEHRERQDDGIGRIAEYCAQTGIDDQQLLSTVKATGGYVLFHKRYSAGYTWGFQQLYRLFRAETSFCLLVSNAPYTNISDPII